MLRGRSIVAPLTKYYGTPCLLPGKMRDKLLNRDVFITLIKAKVLIEVCQKDYNEIRPHSALGYQQPAPEATMVAILT